MYKVKIFKDFDKEEDLEKEINEFLSNQTPQFELFDIKFTLNDGIDGWEHAYMKYSAMIIYYFK